MRSGAKDELREAALALLAKREHSAAELRRKLSRHGQDDETVTALIDSLSNEGLQSDARYLEIYLHMRRERGYGPVRILHELLERGLERELVTQALQAFDDAQWVESARTQLRRRFGEGAPAGYREQAKGSAFLERRGFSGEQIRAAVTSSCEVEA